MKLKKITFESGSNSAAVVKVIHTAMKPFGWGLAKAKTALDAGEIDHLDPKTAEELKPRLEDAGAQDVKISDEE